ncbi:hypothetical protein HK104_000886 [Borealophlyctis nickersoniae]|nr:hypothetical protein HK104_000886 [Borealophlyctis nickersoniae]
MRQIYDQYGPRGIEMLSQMGSVAPFVDPDVILALNRIFFFGSLLAALLIIFPAFVSVRVDSNVSWPWVAVFAPLFVFDAIVLLGFVLVGPGEDAENAAGAVDEEEEELTGAFADDRTEMLSRRERRREEKSAAAWRQRIIRIGYWVLVCVFHVLVALRLDGIIFWPWAGVFAPWFVVEVLNLASATGRLVTDFAAGVPSQSFDAERSTVDLSTRPFTASEKVLHGFDTYYTWLLRVLQAVFLVLKIDGTVDWSWPVVFIPTWLWGGAQLFFLLASYMKLRREPDLSVPGAIHPERVRLIGRAVYFVVAGTLLYAGLGMLIKRLATGDGPPAAIILIPVFIVVGLLFCCVCCCMPCMTLSLRLGLEEELMRREPAGAGMSGAGPSGWQ